MKTEQLQKKEVAESAAEKCIYMPWAQVPSFKRGIIPQKKINKCRSYLSLPSDSQPGGYRSRDFSLFINLGKHD